MGRHTISGANREGRQRAFGEILLLLADAVEKGRDEQPARNNRITTSDLTNRYCSADLGLELILLA
jgi:hypothetical protein